VSFAVNMVKFRTKRDFVECQLTFDKHPEEVGEVKVSEEDVEAAVGGGQHHRLGRQAQVLKYAAFLQSFICIVINCSTIRYTGKLNTV
jgi:hypothetical protein